MKAETDVEAEWEAVLSKKFIKQSSMRKTQGGCGVCGGGGGCGWVGALVHRMGVT